MSSEQWTAAKPSPQVDEIAKRFVGLSHPRLGSKAISCSDDIFAPLERILSPQSPIFVPDKYGEKSRRVDDWESRSKRVVGHDWCIIKIGALGRIHAFDIETSHYAGNFLTTASIEACSGEGEPDENAEWQMLVPQMDLKGDSHHLVEIDNNEVWSYLRLNIFPNGGVARLRVFGETVCRRVPDNDRLILKLGHGGVVENLVVDTKFFKGNFPDRCSFRAALIEGKISSEELAKQSENLLILLPEVKLPADGEHEFADKLADLGPISHLGLDTFSDGGVSRLGLFDKKA